MSTGGDLRDLLTTTASAAGPSVYTASVSALREDGRVNVIGARGRVLGVVCSDAYTHRAVGDRVQVVTFGGMSYTLGRIGADPAFPTVTVPPAGYVAYRAADYSAVSEGPRQVGCSGEGSDSQPLACAFSYYDGTTNQLTAAAKVSGKSGVNLLLTRSGKGHGSPGQARFLVMPHNYDALPLTVSGTAAHFAPVTGMTEVSATLELGEAVFIPIPSDWFAAMIATTPTVRGFVCVPVLADTTNSGYAKFSSVAGGVRVY